MAHFVVPTASVPVAPDFFVTALLASGGSIRVGFALELGEDLSDAIRQVLSEVEKFHGEVVEHFAEDTEGTNV